MLLLKIILPVLLFGQSMPDELHDAGFVNTITEDRVDIGGSWFNCVPGFNLFSDVTYTSDVRNKADFPFYAEIIFQPVVTVDGREELLVKKLNIISKTDPSGEEY